jgi:hypothetical protein
MYFLNYTPIFFRGNLKFFTFYFKSAKFLGANPAFVAIFLKNQHLLNFLKRISTTIGAKIENGYKNRETRCRMMDAGCWMMDVGCRMLDVG